MCISDIRTQKNPFGASKRWGTDGGDDFGVAYFRGQTSRSQDCGTSREVLTPKVVGVAAHLYDASGAIVDDPSSEMRLYLVDMAEADSLEKQGDLPAFQALSALLDKKFLGGFFAGDISKREIYATNFGSGFPAAINAFGGSRWSYATMCLWRAPTALQAQGMMLTDWGWDKSTGPQA